MSGSTPSSTGAPTAPQSLTGTRRDRLARRIRLMASLAMICTIAVSCILTTALIYYTIRFPDPMALRKAEGGAVVKVLARDGTVMLERGQSHPFVPLDLLPRHVIDAVVATEDRRFFDHNGLDPTGLLRAVFANLRAGRYVQGGSTLSQQLAKNLFLSPERTMGRKFEELLLAIWLEVRLPKSDILELYLNRVYFGGGAYGIEGAAHRYFNKPARRLTLAEAAVLAGLLKAPSKYSPASSPGLARQRGRVVLRKMLAAGLIGTEAESAAARQSVLFQDQTAGREATGLEYAVEFALERLPPLIGAGHREIIVETTFDAVLQKRAQALVADALATEGAGAGAGQAAAIVIDRDGGIRALVGGRAFAQSQFNRAVKARRQPGSAFKPFVYLAAVEQGATAETTVIDMPVNIGGWMPRNEGGQHRGAMSMRQALAQSVNTVAVRLQQDVGTRRVIATAKRLGIKSELRPDASLALGTSEVTLMELSGAYAVLASGGLGIEPHAIMAVRSTGSAVLYERPRTRPNMIVAPDHVGVMSGMLNSALVSGTGRRAALARHTAAGKTGTTQDFRDAWFVGYTGHLTAGIWVGNDGGEPMSRVMGGGLPAVMWRNIMQAAHEKMPPAPLSGMAPGPVLPASDTLRDSDLHARPIDSIDELLSLEGQATAAKRQGAALARSPSRPSPAIQPQQRAATEAPAQPPRKQPKAHPEIAPKQHDPGARMRRPAEPIDPDFIARMLEADAPSDSNGMQRRQANTPHRPPGAMGLGLPPPPPGE